MSDWQKGYDLGQLKGLAAPFKARHKALVFGAFGLTKERDVAEALSKNRCIWTGNPPEAVALFQPLKKDSEQQDFAQRPVRIPAGTVLVKAFAAIHARAGARVLEALMSRGQGAPVVVEVFEEDTTARQVMDELSLHWQTTKISAGSEVKGLYSNVSLGLDPLPPEELATLRVVKPGYLSAAEHKAILAELEGAETFFAQHYSSYNKRKSWTAFALHGYQDDPTFIIKPAEMSKSWKEANDALLSAQPRWTEVVSKFPTARKVVERLGVKLDRVRFMRLHAKDGELSRHADITDRDAGVRDGFLTRLHIPIRTSDAVTFFGWSARGEQLTVKFPERALVYLDQRKPHAVKNEAEHERIHLVADVVANKRIRDMVAKAELAAGA